jgi:hypothetical protein
MMRLSYCRDSLNNPHQEAVLSFSYSSAHNRENAHDLPLSPFLECGHEGFIRKRCANGMYSAVDADVNDMPQRSTICQVNTDRWDEATV